MIDQLTGPKYKTRVTKKMKLPTSVRSKMPIRDEVWFKDGLEGVTDNYSCVAKLPYNKANEAHILHTLLISLPNSFLY